MSRIALLCADLLFGSKLLGALTAAGHDVTRFDGEDMARAAAVESDVLVVDLAGDDFDAATLVESMRMGRELDGIATVGFYPHVDRELRLRALDAGIDAVVPRSRLARDAPAVVEAVLEQRRSMRGPH